MTETEKKLTDEEVDYYFDKVYMTGREAYEVLWHMLWDWINTTEVWVLRTLEAQLNQPFTEEAWALSIEDVIRDRTQVTHIISVPKKDKELTEEEMTYYFDNVRISGKESYQVLEYMLLRWIAFGDAPILTTLRNQLPEQKSKRTWADCIRFAQGKSNFTP